MAFLRRVYRGGGGNRPHRRGFSHTARVLLPGSDARSTHGPQAKNKAGGKRTSQLSVNRKGVTSTPGKNDTDLSLYMATCLLWRRKREPGSKIAKNHRHSTTLRPVEHQHSARKRLRHQTRLVKTNPVHDQLRLNRIRLIRAGMKIIVK